MAGEYVLVESGYLTLGTKDHPDLYFDGSGLESITLAIETTEVKAKGIGDSAPQLDIVEEVVQIDAERLLRDTDTDGGFVTLPRRLYAVLKDQNALTLFAGEVIRRNANLNDRLNDHSKQRLSLKQRGVADTFPTRS